MDDAATGTLDLLRYLLPGFVVAWIYFGLTAHYRPDKFERVVQALIFSLFVQALVAVAGFGLLFAGRWFAIGQWSEASALTCSVLLAILLGLGFSWCANNDSCHRVLRKFSITKQTSHPSEWFGAFNDMERYVVLHLKGQRRLIGWPREWPNKSTEGHFLLTEAAWLDKKNKPKELQDEAILIPAAEVELVEFLSPTSKEHV